MDSKNKRLNILEKSLDLEWLLSNTLSKLFRIENQIESVSFGNKSQSLSFNQKVNLLIDSKAINKTEKRYLRCFMELRNQFIHNKGIDSYNKACIATNTTKYLEATFPKYFTENDLETQLANSIEQLYQECGWAISNLKGLSKDLLKQESNLESSKQLSILYKRSLNQSIDEIIVSIDRNKTYSGEEVKNLFENLHINIASNYSNNIYNEIGTDNKGTRASKDENNI